MACDAGGSASQTVVHFRTIESPKHGATVAERTQQEGSHSRTIWRDLAAIQEAGFPLYSEKDGQKSRWSFVEGYTFHLPVPFQGWSHSHLTSPDLRQRAKGKISEEVHKSKKRRPDQKPGS